ncbi:MAG: thiamine phosphate synthase [Alphaproteobacteria bacterium]|nr:thiamine phosphate synthase [Alphaproteobacteria bacterium]MBF0130563.1 thiamine phosphate synthase [Alphaproteobacteria bacterium]
MNLADLAFVLNSRAHRSGRALPSLLLLTDDRRGPDPLAAARSLPRGAGVVLRSASGPVRESLARALSIVCRRRGLFLIVSEDWRLAAEVGAHGLHLPERLARVPPAARVWLSRGRLLTAAAHSPAALARAGRIGADAALLSPVFPTESHPGAAGIGRVRFAAWTRAAPVPVYALGGLREKTILGLVDSGAVGLATVGGLGFAP